MSSAIVFVSLQHNPPLPFIHVREIKEYETDGDSWGHTPACLRKVDARRRTCAERRWSAATASPEKGQGQWA